jgi:hypothetical protein
MPASDSTGPREPGLAQTLEALAQAAQPDTASALSDVDLDAYDPGADFKARITLTADGGTEFSFPPMRAAAKATAQTAVFVVSLGLFILADTQTEASLPLLASWGIIELLFFLWILRLWFAPERVVIGNGVVTYTYGLFGKTRTMPTAQVAAIHAVHGSATQYSAIRIKGAGWQMFNVGDGIRNRKDAEWLALQMRRVADVKASADVPQVLEDVQSLSALANDRGYGGLMKNMDAIVSSRAVVSDRATSTNPQASSETARPTRFARLAMRIVGPVLMVAIFGMWMRMDRARTVYVNNQDNGRSLHIPAGDVLRIALIMDSGSGAYRIVANDPGLLKPRGTAFPDADQPAGVQESEVLYFSAVKKGTVYLRIESTLPLDRSQSRDYVYALNLTID